MFGWSKPSPEKMLVRAIERLNRDIDREVGGIAGVCSRFLAHAEQDELFKMLGVLAEAGSPHPKPMVLQSALQLLYAARQESDPAKGERLIEYSGVCFKLANRIVSDDELKAMLFMAAEEAQSFVRQKTEAGELSWGNWREGDISALGVLCSR